MVLVNRGVTVPAPGRMYSPNYQRSEIILYLDKIVAISRTYHPPEALVYGGNVL